MLELLTLSHADESTRDLMSDDFMGGFLFKIVSDKWRTWAKVGHYLASVPEAIRTILMTAIAVPSAFEDIPSVEALQNMTLIGADQNSQGPYRSSDSLVHVAVPFVVTLLGKDLFELIQWIRARQTHFLLFGSDKAKASLLSTVRAECSNPGRSLSLAPCA